jgi:hypothetical protein
MRSDMSSSESSTPASPEHAGSGLLSVLSSRNVSQTLVWEDEAGRAWLTYNDPNYLAERHEVRDHTETIQPMTAALQALARAATGP